jgi:hypothetical protein
VGHPLEPRRGIEGPHRDELVGPGVQLLVQLRELVGQPGHVELRPDEGVLLLDRAGDLDEPLHGAAHHLDQELQAAAGARPGRLVLQDLGDERREDRRQVGPDGPDDDRPDDRRQLAPDDLGQCLLQVGPREPAGLPGPEAAGRSAAASGVGVQ